MPNLKSIFSILNEKQAKSPLMRGAAAGLIVEDTDRILAELIGPQISQYVKAAHLKNGVLAVQCTGSSAAAEIRLREKDILAKLREKFGQDAVTRIVYRA